MSDLAGFSVLRELSDAECARLLELLEERHLDAGDALFRARDEAEELLFIAAGRLRIEVDGKSHGELAAGQVLGAASLVVIGDRACDAVASEPTRLLGLSREAYLRLRGDYPHVALALQEGILRDFASLVREALAAPAA